MFAIINKMDSDTYRAWEKYRATLAKAATNRDANEPNNTQRPGKHIPTWPELEQFLEGEVTIRVHAEKRNREEESQPNAGEASKKRQNPFRKQNDQNNEKNAESHSMLQCPICNGAHRVHECQAFIDMDIVDRLDKVAEHNLCDRCLRITRAGRCVNRKSNQICPECLPDDKYHNSLLCPNAGTSTSEDDSSQSEETD